jgi:haloacetate dehalogenase
VSRYFEGFETKDIETPGARIRVCVGGSGSPILLLHGHPESHMMWHVVAPVLARSHTVVATDLRGYGNSSKPAAGPDHAEYSKREMAADQVAVMSELGFDRFALAGHDRGARVSHRLCLDHADRVERVAMLDIVPTHYMLNNVDRDLALAYYHHFFFSQPADLPERLLGGDPEYFLRTAMAKYSSDDSPFEEDIFAEYLESFRDPAMLSATCEDFRASHTIDLEQDDQSLSEGARITAPLLALWGSTGFVGKSYDVVDVWSRYATNVSGAGVNCGHFMPEEDPVGTAAVLAKFFDEV